MKRIYVDAPTIVGGNYYDSSPVPQFAPDAIADYLVSIGNARYFETKVVEVMEKKTLSASPAGQASPPTMQPTRRGRKPKS